MARGRARDGGDDVQYKVNFLQRAHDLHYITFFIFIFFLFFRAVIFGRSYRELDRRWILILGLCY